MMKIKTMRIVFLLGIFTILPALIQIKYFHFNTPMAAAKELSTAFFTEVDVYQNCESGNNGDVLTEIIMDASTYGAGLGPSEFLFGQHDNIVIGGSHPSINPPIAS